MVGKFFGVEKKVNGLVIEIEIVFNEVVIKVFVVEGELKILFLIVINVGMLMVVGIGMEVDDIICLVGGVNVVNVFLGYKLFFLEVVVVL